MGTLHGGLPISGVEIARAKRVAILVLCGHRMNWVFEKYSPCEESLADLESFL